MLWDRVHRPFVCDCVELADATASAELVCCLGGFLVQGNQLRPDILHYSVILIIT